MVLIRIITFRYGNRAVKAQAEKQFCMASNHWTELPETVGTVWVKVSVYAVVEGAATLVFLLLFGVFLAIYWPGCTTNYAILCAMPIKVNWLSCLMIERIVRKDKWECRKHH